jgi:xanthine dehydrogenase accessory factor
MYDIALSVSAFVRSNTHAEIAWMVSPHASVDALALTPGGGRIGTVAQGIFDLALADIANIKLSQGRLVSFTVGEFESSLSSYPAGTQTQFLLIPVSQFPVETWAALLNRDPVGIVCKISDGTVNQILSFTKSNIDSADESIVELFNKGQSVVAVQDDQVVTVLFPKTKLVIAGSGPIAEAIAEIATTLNWSVRMETRNDIVAGYVADMSPMDGVVVLGHNVEQSSRSLELALESNAGYIGALGSRKMQEDRADWLAYRDVTDLTRVNGPAGLNIQANSAGEIAVSVIAEMIAVLKAQ